MGSFSSLQKSNRETVKSPQAERTHDYARSTAPLAFPTPPQRDRTPADLARMIESEIIPRLMVAHRGAPAPAPVETHSEGVGAHTLDAFVHMTLTSEASTLVAFAESLIRGGLSLSEVYVDLLSPAARRLGDDWNEDRVSFTDVTIGLGRLQQVVRMMAWRMPGEDLGEDACSAYFIPCPQEQHTFGLFILEDDFRRSGWRTRLDTSASYEEAADAVRTDWFDVFGLSVVSDAPAERIAAVLKGVRKASCNPDLFVMVGGRAFIDNPDLSSQVGADACATTSAQALLIAAERVSRRAFG